MHEFEIVNIKERALIAISLGESHFREFKSALHGPFGQKQIREIKLIRKDIGEALVAFANADGGELLIGVEDNGEVTGLESLGKGDLESLKQSPVTQVHRDTPLPPVRMAELVIDNKVILYFSILKSTDYIHLTSDGRCLQRKDLQTVPIPPETIILERREKESREYDRQYIDGATVADLNIAQLRIIADTISPGMSVEKCLQYLDLAEYIGPGLRLRRAALLLFALQPNRWHPRLQIRILQINGTELLAGPKYNVKADETVNGNIIELVDKGWEALRPKLVQTKLDSEARFSTTVMYPELACREALINAIAHRDYSDEGRGIEVYVYDDRMVVKNPGLILSTIRISDLLKLDGVHQSRNAIIARVLREMGYMRELGEGIRRMFELMHQNELTDPEISCDSSSFIINLKHKTIYNDQQKLWLDEFKEFELNKDQKALVVLGMNNRLISPNQIWDAISIVDTEQYRIIVASLQRIGVLSSEITKEAAQRKAKSLKCSVRDIPRFRFRVPEKKDPKTSTQPKTVYLNRIFIRNLPFSINESELLHSLSSICKIEKAEILKDQYGNSRGYAIITLTNEETIDDAISKINQYKIEGRLLWAKRDRK